MLARCLQGIIPTGHPRAPLTFYGREELQLARQSEIGIGNDEKDIDEAGRRSSIVGARAILIGELPAFLGVEH